MLGIDNQRNLTAGVALGLLSSLVLPMSLGMTPLIMLPTLIVALLGVWSGVIAAAVATGAHLVMAAMTGGGALALMVGEAMLLPAWGVIYLIVRRPRFGQGVTWSALISLAASVAIVLTAWLAVRGNLIDVLAEYLRGVIDALPMEFKDVAVQLAAQMGFLGATVPSGLAQAELIDRAIHGFSAWLQLSFAALLVVSSVTTGAVSYWLSARVVLRRGDAPRIDYLHPRQWHILPSMVVGLPACAGVCLIAYNLKMPGADAAYNVFYNLCVLAFCVQGMGAVDRRLFAASVPKGYRTLLMVALALLREYTAIVGLFSALMGARGLITRFIKRRMDSNGKGDDDA